MRAIVSAVPGPDFETHPWTLPLRRPDVDSLAAVESIFTLANGHVGLRGTLEEGEPRARPGTYLNGVYEEWPLPHAEAGYGYPESSQTVVNVTDGKLIRLIVEDAPFDMRYGDVTAHERILDLRTGLLSRRDRLDVAERPVDPGRIPAAGLLQSPDDCRHFVPGHTARPGHLRCPPVGPPRQRAGRQPPPG